jgi:hypothetical protein
VGGDAACAHEWGSEMTRRRGGAHGPFRAGLLRGGTRGIGEAQARGKRVRAGIFCRACGAWRGCLGLEPTPATRAVTVGWRPTCDCDRAAQPVPAVVLDPFSGAGTTALAALRLGREAIGIELNARYVAIAARTAPGRRAAAERRHCLPWLTRHIKRHRADLVFCERETTAASLAGWVFWRGETHLADLISSDWTWAVPTFAA